MRIVELQETSSRLFRSLHILSPIALGRLVLGYLVV